MVRVSKCLIFALGVGAAVLTMFIVPSYGQESATRHEDTGNEALPEVSVRAQLDHARTAAYEHLAAGDRAEARRLAQRAETLAKSMILTDPVASLSARSSLLQLTWQANGPASALEKADQLLDETERLYTKRPHEAVIHCQAAVAQFLMHVGHPKDAIAAADSVLTKACAMYVTDTELVIRYHRWMFQQCRLASETDKGIQVATRAIGIAEQAYNDRPFDLVRHQAWLAQCYVDAGRTDSALDLFERLAKAERSRKGRPPRVVLKYHAELAILYIRTGRPEEAVASVDRYVQWSKANKLNQHDPELGGRLTRARVYHHAGRWKEAINEYELLRVDIANGFSERRDLMLRVLRQLATIYLEQRRVEDARNCIHEAKELIRVHTFSRRDQIYVQFDQAHLLSMIGQHDRAIDIWLDAIAELEDLAEADDGEILGNARLHAASAYLRMGRLSQAREQVNLALKHLTHVRGMTGDQIGHALTLSGQLHWIQGQVEAAAMNFEFGARSAVAADPQLRRAENARTRMAALIRHGDMLIRTGKPGSGPIMSEVVATLDSEETGVAPAENVMFLEAMALGYANAGRWDEWYEVANQLRRLSHAGDRQMLTLMPEREQIRYHLRQGGELDQLSELIATVYRRGELEEFKEATAEWVLNGKAVLQELLAKRIRATSDTTDVKVQAAYRQLIARRRQIAGLNVAISRRKHSAEELSRSRQELANAWARFEEEEREMAYPLFREEDPIRWWTIDDLREALSPNTVYVEILRVDIRPHPQTRANEVAESRYLAWIVRRGVDEPVDICDLGDANVIDTKVRKVHALLATSAQSIALQARQDEAEEKAKRLLRDISALVLDPIAPSIINASHVVICPSGDLWLLPWSALVFEDGHYLIEKTNLTTSLVVSGRSLLQDEVTKLSERPSVVMADPDFNHVSDAKSSPAVITRRFSRLGELSEAEGVEIARLLQTQPLLGPTAAENALFGVQGPRILVLSTHGFFEQEAGKLYDFVGLDSGLVPNRHPLLSCGLAFAGANVQLHETGEDGILTGFEIVGLDLRGTEIVVLSACESELGMHRVGESVASLRQAFQLAGAQSVVATLWRVDTGQTRRLMTGFLEDFVDTEGNGSMARVRATKAHSISLHNAQRSIMARRAYSHPYFWAGIVLTGM